MYLLLGRVTYTQVSSILLGIYFLNMAKPLPTAMSALSSTRKWCFILFRCQFPWKPWCFYNVSLEKHFRMPPRNLFLSHFLVFTSFLVCSLLIWAPPAWGAVLGSIPPSTKGSYTSQTASAVSGSWPEETSEMWWSWPWKCHSFSGGKAEVPSANVSNQGQSRHLDHEFACNHSYLQSICMSSSDPYLNLVKHHV